MENKKHSSDRFTARVAVAVSVLSLAVSVVAVGMAMIYGRKMDIENQLLRKMLQVDDLKVSPVSSYEHQMVKRDVAAVNSDQSEALLNELSLADVVGLRGPPGKGGRDGKDGRDGENGRDGKDGRDGRDSRNDQELTMLTQILQELRIHNEESSETLSDGAKDLVKIVNETVTLTLAQRDDLVGLQGPPGQNGANGEDGRDGKDGRDGENGGDGKDCLSDTLVQQGLLRNRSGSSYVRWGRTTCPESSQLVYEGFVGGQFFDQQGGASDRVCLPLDPEWSTYTIANDQGNIMYGAEYKVNSDTSSIFSSALLDQNVPCAICYSTGRVTTLMIPAKRSCPDDTWTKEYEGYLMTEHWNHKSSAPYICVDADPEAIEGMHARTNGATLYFVQAYCDNMGHCPPYVEFAELTCVVCTK